MKTNNNIPAYRFQGYTDAWELRKLGEVVEVCSGRDYKHLGVGSIPVYGTGGYMLSVSEALSKNNDAIGIGRKGTIDSPYILRAPFWTVDTLFYCIPNDGFTLEFAYSIFQNINWKSMDESTGVPSLSKNGINNVKVLTPKIKEQSAIGTFFSTLDQHITLHQRKLDTLKERKKTYLKLLFPAKGQTKPALRFQGFEDDWEEVKLGEVAKMYQPQTITGGDLIEEGIPVFGANGYIGYYSYCNHVTDQVTISARGEGTGTPNFVKAPVWITGNSMVINVDENKDIDKKFLYSNFLAYDFKKYVSGGAQPQLTRDVLSLVKISIPTLSEQEAIGTFFQTLDQEIAQVEDKLASLKEMKKTLLRKLFV
ncbi:TPA: restriction endonuclease subunit S [Streptococcus suis]|nr:restriction endonuclease subunit S [Streptococcus suis]